MKFSKCILTRYISATAVTVLMLLQNYSLTKKQNTLQLQKHPFSQRFRPDDLVLNVLLFVPFGFTALRLTASGGADNDPDGTDGTSPSPRASSSSTPDRSAYQPSSHPKINGATIVASLSTIYFGVPTSSLPQVIFSFGTAPE